MKAIVFKNNKLAIEEIDSLQPADGEVLIKTRLAGICNTDLEICRGYMGFEGVLGHEFVGEVIGPKGSSLYGKRVVGEINLGCGECELCRKKDSRHCSNRTVLGIFNKNGAFSEYISLPEENLFPIPDGITDEDAVLIEPLAAAHQIIEQTNISTDHKILIIGDGKLGLLIAMVFKSKGYDLTLVGNHSERNIKILPNVSHLSPKELRIQSKWDFIVEASGNQKGLIQALNVINPTGTIVLKSTYSDKLTFDIAPVVINELKIIGSRCGRFSPVIELLNNNSLSIPKDYFEQTYSFEKFVSAFEHAQKKGALKVLLKP